MRNAKGKRINILGVYAIDVNHYASETSDTRLLQCYIEASPLDEEAFTCVHDFRENLPIGSTQVPKLIDKVTKIHPEIFSQDWGISRPIITSYTKQGASLDGRLQTGIYIVDEQSVLVTPLLDEDQLSLNQKIAAELYKQSNGIIEKDENDFSVYSDLVFQPVLNARKHQESQHIPFRTQRRLS